MANGLDTTDYSGLSGWNTGGLNVTQGATSGDWLSSLSSLFSKNSMFGGTNTAGQQSTGWVSPLAALGSTLFGAYQGSQQLQLAQDQFDESKREFNVNYAAQKQTTNTELEDRQRARVAANPNAYQSVSDYMAANAIK